MFFGANSLVRNCEVPCAVHLHHSQLQELGDVVEEGEGEDGNDVELPHRHAVTELRNIFMIKCWDGPHTDNMIGLQLNLKIVTTPTIIQHNHNTTSTL